MEDRRRQSGHFPVLSDPGIAVAEALVLVRDGAKQVLAISEFFGTTTGL
jgi:hypothetical protein